MNLPAAVVVGSRTEVSRLENMIPWSQSTKIVSSIRLFHVSFCEKSNLCRLHNVRSFVQICYLALMKSLEKLLIYF